MIKKCNSPRHLALFTHIQDSNANLYNQVHYNYW